MSKKPPRSHHKREAWESQKPAPSRRTGLRSIGFTEAQVGRTERKLNTYAIPKGNSKKAQVVRHLLLNGEIALAAKFVKPIRK
jgi:hypothetical protein